MKMYTEEQIRVAVSEALENYAYEPMPSMSAIEDEIWRQLAITEEPTWNK